MRTHARQQFDRRRQTLQHLCYVVAAAVGGVLGLMYLVAPVATWPADAGPDHLRLVAADLIASIPVVFYLMALVFLGRAAGSPPQGRPLHCGLAKGLQRMGVCLATGGLISVFIVSNASRWLGASTGGYLHFDPAGLTLAVAGAGLLLVSTLIDHAVDIQTELDAMV